MSELPSRPGKIILRGEEAAAWVDGYAFLERARQHVDNLEAETHKATAAARAEGFETGRHQGEQQAAELLARTTQRVERYLGGLDQSLADLSLQIVRRILGEYDDAELISRCVRQALREYRHDMNVTVRVAPDQVANVESLLATTNADGGSPCRVEGDAQLSATQCLLVSPVAVVDVGLDSQLRVLRQALSAGSERVS